MASVLRRVDFAVSRSLHSDFHCGVVRDHPAAVQLASLLGCPVGPVSEWCSSSRACPPRAEASCIFGLDGHHRFRRYRGRTLVFGGAVPVGWRNEAAKFEGYQAVCNAAALAVRFLIDPIRPVIGGSSHSLLVGVRS